ncbi:MAG TPA: hypothetical protein VMR34_04430 [Candidatus Saccharimonadales bacterium]|nr:hypothetical protein [Candidatus Saccharimonadales bacterium]
MRYILSVIGVIVFVVVIIVLIATSSSKKPNGHSIDITNYNYSSSSVSQTTDGPLVGEDQRQAIKIQISQAERVIYILNGYEQNISGTEAYANTPAAYQAFLGALDTYGFTKSRTTTETNIEGTCPLGNTYIYELNNGSGDISDLWSTSCSLKDGTFFGDGPLLRQLFQLQIPNYESFTTNVVLSVPTE